MTRRKRRLKRRAIEWLKDFMASGGEIRIPEIHPRFITPFPSPYPSFAVSGGMRLAVHPLSKSDREELDAISREMHLRVLWMEELSKFEFVKPCGGGNCPFCYLIGKKCVNEEEK